MRVRAFAKINLSLRVLGVRPDGYHELRTIFQSIALHDTLVFRRTTGPFRLECDDPACPSNERNLVWRAAERLWKASGRKGPPRNVAVSIRKRIPVAGGLGGGSSDAAAAIRALGTLWHVPLGRQRTIAWALGADIPYFFEGGTALGLGRGDLLFPLHDHPARAVLLVLPRFGVSTADAFGWWDAGHGSSTPRRRVTTPSAEAVGPEQFRNDLEPPVAARHPEIGRIVRRLRRSGAVHAAMSGSGSTVFGLFSTRPAAERAAADVEGRGRRVVLTRTLSRTAYARLAATEPIG